MTSDGDLYKTDRNITKKNLKNLVSMQLLLCFTHGQFHEKEEKKKKKFFSMKHINLIKFFFQLFRNILRKKYSKNH